MLPGIAGLAGKGGASGASDPNFSSVVLLMGAEGADGSTTVLDESSFAHTLTAANGAVIDTAQLKYGTSSLLINAAGAHVNSADSDDWTLAGDFTIEAWVRASTINASNCIVAHHPGWAFLFTAALIRFYLDADGLAGGLVDLNASWSPSTDTWYHLCADRSGNTIRTYVDGVMKGKHTTAVVPANNGNMLRIGSIDGTTERMTGWIDELRITAGLARYASDSGFTPPTEAYPRA